MKVSIKPLQADWMTYQMRSYVFNTKTPPMTRDQGGHTSFVLENRKSFRLEPSDGRIFFDSLVGKDLDTEVMIVDDPEILPLKDVFHLEVPINYLGIGARFDFGRFERAQRRVDGKPINSR